MGTNYSFHMPAQLNELVDLRCFIEERLAFFSVGPEKAHDILLTMDELATNIILHGYQGQQGFVEVQLVFQDNAVTMVLKDSAPLFDPTKHPSPDLTLPLDKRPIGGMGIHLARQLMDEMQYRVTEAGENELTLIKHNILAKEENDANHS
jgi:anti-sigma regulatory factor (Ser/Thr protein kinase)